MDKSWIDIEERTLNKNFQAGLERFLDFAYKNKKQGSRIKCPCTRCRNSIQHLKEDVYLHVMRKGFLQTYKNWVYHGEEPLYLNRQNVDCTTHQFDETDDMMGLINEGLGIFKDHIGVHENLESSSLDPESGTPQRPNLTEVADEEAQNFFKLLKHAETELFPGCEDFTLLSFIVRLLHVKSLCRWSNSSFTILLEVLKMAFKGNEMFPGSYREAWKMLKDLGLDYLKIHACPNDCMLYWKDAENDDYCKHCKCSRYKQFDGKHDDSSKREQKVPAKLVRYFPLKPRLRRLFMSSKTASLMRWHVEERVDNNQ